MSASPRLIQKPNPSLPNAATTLVPLALNTSQARRLLADLEPAALDAVFGIYQEKPDKKSKAVQYEPDPALRDFENVPLKEDIVSFFLREVQPFVLDAWISPEIVDEKDGGIGKVGYEINFNRVFFRYEPPRPLDEIDTELEQVEKRILTLLKEVTA